MAIFKIGKQVMGSLFKKPATLMYPAIPRVYGEITRGAVDINIEGCVFCGICSQKCPAHAINVDRKKKSWSIERMRCIQCNCCVEKCPTKCLSMGNQYTTPDYKPITDTFVKPIEEKPAPAPKVEKVAVELAE